MKTNTITINGIAVELQWGEGYELGRAVHTVPVKDLGDGVANGPSDGEEFEFEGVKYRLGSHNYSTDQPGNEDDDDCTCSADIYAVEE